MIKIKCYECKYRRNIPGDCHSRCVNPRSSKELNICADAHGIKNGWFMWPFNFDPVWLENCDGFSKLETEEGEGHERD